MDTRQLAPIIVCAAVTIGFAAASVIVLTRAVPESSVTLANVLLGVLAIKFGQVCDYWLGSSAGSEHKTALLASALPAPPAGSIVTITNAVAAPPTEGA